MTTHKLMLYCNTTLLIALMLLLLSSCDTETVEKPETLPQKIGQILENQPDNDPGLSILIKKSGILVYRGNTGIARQNELINSDTQFRIASVAKPITALAIMKLVEDGLLNLDDKLIDIVGNLPESYSDITIEHLLSHRSGLLDYINDNNDVTNLNNLTTASVVDLLDGSGLENLQFAPGTSGDYSNTGYVLLALVIESVSGFSYPDYMDNEIFEPLGMTDTFIISESQHLGDRGNNYALSFGNEIMVQGFNSLIYGANGIVSTTNDMLKFIDALTNEEIISNSTLTQMIQNKGPLPGIANYGLGWMLGSGNYWHSNKYSSTSDYWHTGGFGGYRTIMSNDPNKDLQIIILSNNGEYSQDIMFDIVELTKSYYIQ